MTETEATDHLEDAQEMLRGARPRSCRRRPHPPTASATASA